MNFNDLLAYAQSSNVKYGKQVDWFEANFQRGKNVTFSLSPSVNICYVVEIPEKKWVWGLLRICWGTGNLRRGVSGESCSWFTNSFQVALDCLRGPWKQTWRNIRKTIEQAFSHQYSRRSVPISIIIQASPLPSLYSSYLSLSQACLSIPSATLRFRPHPFLTGLLPCLPVDPL